MAKETPGHIVDGNGHQINHLMTGDFGNLEILLMAFDDGDVVAYYTHTIADYISGRSEIPPEELIHENVGSSAWGLAIHKKSRLLAVSSNAKEITVFALALTAPPGRLEEVMMDDSPTLACGQTALELQRSVQSRTASWRIVLPLGKHGHNVPSISFCDNVDGEAETVVACSVIGCTWFFDIWKVGSQPIVYHRPPDAPGEAQAG
jgi:hypothetical protein